MKSLVWILAGVSILAAAAGSARAESPIWAPPTLKALIDEGLSQNREIQSQAVRVESLQAEIDFAGSLEDPMLGFGVLNLPTDTFDFDQEPMTQKQVSISQKFPWFGKLDLRSQRAALLAIRANALLNEQKLFLAQQIADAYYQIGFVEHSLRINDRLSETISRLLGEAETRYATGKGLQQDVLQAQVELSMLVDERITLERRRRSLEDRILALLNRDTQQRISEATTPPEPGFELELEPLRGIALNRNPALQIRQAEIDITETDIELARKAYWPDMDVRLAYGQRDEDFTGRDLPDFFSAQVVINLPVWQKTRQDSRLKSSLKNRLAAEKSYRNLTESLPHQVDALVNEITRLKRNYSLYGQALILQAEHWAQSALVAYEVGKLAFDSMISAQIRLLRFHLQKEDYLFQIYRKRAELEALLGGPLPAVVSGGVEPTAKEPEKLNR
ncbi:MAG TPA: TolC family protein [Desulfobacterales bacterium]